MPHPSTPHRTISVPLHCRHNIPYADLTHLRHIVSSAHPSQTFHVHPDNDAAAQLNYLRFATVVFNAITAAGNPRLNVIVTRSPTAYHHSNGSISDNTTQSQHDSTWECVAYNDYPFAIDATTHDIHASNNVNEPTFETVAVGGTFDRLHAGHRLLLTVAAWVTSKSLLVGITADDLLNHKQHRSAIADVHTRGNNAIDYVRQVAPSLPTVQMSILYDAAGASATDPNVQALVVSSETVVSARHINDTRERTGLKRFVIIVVDVLKQHDQSKLSSTALRREDENETQKHLSSVN